MDCRPTDQYEGAQRVCEQASAARPDGVFLNALAESMPECDRNERMTTLEHLEDAASPPDCYVYCAQRSCGAAATFMRAHADELSRKCASVSYLHGGALEMERADLVDGEACHRNVVAHNLSEGLQDGCLTCEAGDRVPLRATIDDVPVDATYLQTRGEIPDWYRRSGIVGALPTQFSCDPRYRSVPVPHHHEGSSRVKVNLSSTPISPNATVAYWAADASDEVLPAERAYGAFKNSGIVQCEKAVCEFRLDRPGRYTSEGKVFKSHLHLTEWMGDRWSLRAKTIDIE